VLSLAVLLRDRCDTLLLGWLTVPATVGFYSVGAEVAALPTTELIEPLCRASFSGFAAARRAGVAVGETWLRLMGTAALLTLPAGAGLSAVAGPLVALAFGHGWEPAVPVLRVLALAGTLMVFGQVSLHLMSAHALLGRLVGITLTGAVLRVALLAALIPGFGLPGAALAAAASIAVEQALTVGLALRRFRVGVGAFLRHVWRPSLASAAMVAVLWGLGLGCGPADAGVPGLLAAVGVGATVYGGVLLLAWLVSGRPEGAEADVLGVLQRAWARRRPVSG
jgi:O-antigen/teichoic acid export membrane protein